MLKEIVKIRNITLAFLMSLLVMFPPLVEAQSFTVFPTSDSDSIEYYKSLSTDIHFCKIGDISEKGITLLPELESFVEEDFADVHALTLEKISDSVLSNKDAYTCQTERFAADQRTYTLEPGIWLYYVGNDLEKDDEDHYYSYVEHSGKTVMYQPGIVIFNGTGKVDIHLKPEIKQEDKPKPTPSPTTVPEQKPETPHRGTSTGVDNSSIISGFAAFITAPVILSVLFRRRRPA